MVANKNSVRLTSALSICRIDHNNLVFSPRLLAPSSFPHLPNCISISNSSNMTFEWYSKDVTFESLLYFYLFWSLWDGFQFSRKKNTFNFPMWLRLMQLKCVFLPVYRPYRLLQVTRAGRDRWPTGWSSSKMLYIHTQCGDFLKSCRELLFCFSLKQFYSLNKL